jgi:hypothetical protein
VQPWEYGSIPKGWLEALGQVDEVWAYTEYVRDCYLAAGVPAERVHVVPLGVDCERFSPQAPPLPLPTKKRFKFLFVGGTIHRKGIDVLLEAYARTFTAGRGRAGPPCYGRGRRSTSPASTRGCAVTRRGTTWRSSPWRKGTWPGRRPTGARPCTNNRGSRRHGLGWERSPCAGLVGPLLRPR